MWRAQPEAQGENCSANSDSLYTYVNALGACDALLCDWNTAKAVKYYKCLVQRPQVATCAPVLTILAYMAVQT